jgi:hypothetical protein
MRKVLSAKDNLTARRFDEPKDGAPERCLSASGLADQAERFAGENFKRYTIDSFDSGAFAEQRLSHLKVDAQIFDRDQ